MADQTLESIIVFTDGACTGNPGPGGWAAVVAFPEGQIRELGGGNPQTTNNRMELVGALKALQALDGRSEAAILYTDSVYVIRGITEWIWNWRRRGWKNAEGNEILNQDLWEELFIQASLRKEFGLQWKYVRGHTGVPGNERCDEIAVAFSKGKKIALFDGSLLHYPHAIYDLPPDQDLPEMRSNSEPKKAAYSYLSMIGGIVVRHKSWTGCELRVKGKAGAKFKKAMSHQDEKLILQSWGVDPQTVKIQEDPR